MSRTSLECSRRYTPTASAARTALTRRSRRSTAQSGSHSTASRRTAADRRRRARAAARPAARPRHHRIRLGASAHRGGDPRGADRTPFLGPPRVRVGGGYGSRRKVATGAVGWGEEGRAGDDGTRSGMRGHRRYASRLRRSAPRRARRGTPGRSRCLAPGQLRRPSAARSSRPTQRRTRPGSSS